MGWFLGAFLLRPGLNELDARILRLSIPGAARWLVNRGEMDVRVLGLTPETTRILREEPVLLLGNHPFDAEPVPLLSALPIRWDLHIIGSSHLTSMGPNFTKHLIPVHVVHQVDEIKLFHLKLSAFFRKLSRMDRRISVMEASRFNLVGMEQAKQRLRQGAMVVLFPQGLRGKGALWLGGVGRLARDLQEWGKGFLVFAHVKGTSNFDILRIPPLIRRLMPPVYVHFSKPIWIADIDPASSRELRERLNSMYMNWVDSL